MPELGSPQLTSKELSMIEDQLAHEQLAIAKLQAYSAKLEQENTNPTMIHCLNTLRQKK